ncbi:DUF1294 domain-containing protein [Anaerobacillus alkalidiazotrophicus]|nr:DUF1294 domain-containing protein [Anaerobacillus alkalidiazotrophicus]
MTSTTIVAYAFFINIVSFVYMFVDKQKAIKGQWRISERKFFLLAIIGGSVGIMLGMRAFRHKTKHNSFRIGMPVIMIIQIVLMSYHYL